MAEHIVISGSRANRPQIFGIIAIVWSAGLVLLLVAHLFGAPVGLSVNPTGEDRTWTDLLARPGYGVFRDWWSVHSRNPLAPWWYFGFSPLIENFSSGLYIARKILDLFLGLSVALLINELNKGRRVTFALACGVLVLLWNFSGYIEQVMFVMLISVGFSLLSVYFYVRYLNNRRSRGEHLAISLLAFLIALATYSIQCGVPLAIAALSMAYGNRGLPPDEPQHPLKRSLIDTGFFIVIFVIFMQIWLTASGPTSSYFQLNPKLFLTQFGASLGNFVWHSDTTKLLSSLLLSWPVYVLVFLFFGTGLIFYNFFQLGYSQQERRAPTDDELTGWKNPVFLGVLVAICLVIPTILIEATSNIWFPGSRSRMVLQVFQPIAYLGIAYFLVMPLRKKRNFLRIQAIVTAVLCAFAVVVGLEYNRQLVELSNYEERLINGLKKFVPTITKPSHLFVRIDNSDWYGGRNTELNKIFVQLAYKSTSVWLDTIFKGDLNDPARAVAFGSNEQGVFSPATGTYVPYSESIFFTYDGKDLKVIDSIDQTTFKGYQVKNAVPVNLLPVQSSFAPKLSCPTAINFDSTMNGQGWSVPEKARSGDTFIWMAAKTATVAIDTSCKGELNLKFRTLQPLSSEVQSTLKLVVRGKQVPLKVTTSPDSTSEYAAVLSQNAVTSDGKLVLNFSVEKTMIPTGGTRELAVPFDWIRLNSISTTVQ